MGDLLRRKVGLVTGASRGIGRNIAIELAREGADVVIAARSETESDPRLPGTIYSVAEECRALGVRALPVVTDMTEEGSIDRLFQQALAEFGHVDVVVNNAGLNFPGPLLDLTLKRWDLLWTLNVRGTIVSSRHAIEAMLKQGGGTIVNISSTGADNSGKNSSAYAVTKQAVRKLAQAVAAEYGEQGIRSFSLSPTAVVSTPGHRYIRGANAVSPERAEAEHVMGRAVVWMATAQDAPGSNGQHFYSIPLVAERLREDTTWDGLRKLQETGRATAS